jgi:CCR4-NOT transcription complex subunit 1
MCVHCSTLKNLGAWLGKVTLGRNRPLLYRDLNPKELLLEAYETGRLIAVVPFVAKILEAAADSPVFRPPNPWTVALLSAMRELYEVPDLKLNLKFEVEVLCKALSIDIKDIRQGTVLHKRRRPALTSNPDFNLKAALSPDNLPGIVPRTDGADGASGSGQGSNTASTGMSISIPGLLQLITISAFSSVLPPASAPGDGSPVAAAGNEDPGAERDEPGSARAALRALVASAVDRSLREYLQPVVERSVTIATITARELITKDFATEADAEKVATAARAFACDLAGSLAQVTCQEPLKIAIGAQLRALLLAGGGGGTAAAALALLPVPIASLGEQANAGMVAAAVAETLTVASALVEKASIDRASKAVDEALAVVYAARRQAAAERAALPAGAAPPPFVDAAVLNPGTGSKWPGALPESLRPRAGVGVLPHQMRVYDGFSESFLSQHSAGATAAAAPAGPATQASAPAQSAAAGPQAASSQPLHQQQRAGAAQPAGPSAVSMAPAAAVAAFAAAGPDTATGGLGSGQGSVASAATIAAASLAGVSAFAPATANPPLAPGPAMHEYNQLLERLTSAIRATAASAAVSTPHLTAANIGPNAIGSLPRDHELAVVLREMRAVGLRLSPGNHREEVCLVQAQKLFRGLFELPSPPASVLDGLALYAYLAALVGLQDLCTKLRKDLVSYLGYIPEDRRYTSDAVLIGLLRAYLLHLPDFDAFVAKATDSGRNVAALRLGMLVAQRAIVQVSMSHACTLAFVLMIAAFAPCPLPVL